MIKRATLIPLAMRGYEVWQNSKKHLGLDIHAHAMKGLIVAFTSDEAEELETIMIERRDAGCPI